MITQHGSGAEREAGMVWDWPLRVFHWALVVSVAGAWATHYAGLEWFDWHRRLGYATIILVTFRIVWGFVGTQHARFASFVRGPRAIAGYLGSFRTAAPMPPGHNPLGALSVVAFLLVLLVQAGTGLFANDEIANAGPFFSWVERATSNRLTSIHRFNANVLLSLVTLHLLAIAYYDCVGKAGLTRMLVSGHRPGIDGIAGSRGWLAVLVVGLLSVALALAIRSAPEATISLF